MANRSILLLSALFLLLLSACTARDEVIPSAQAIESTPASLYPPLAADADPGDTVYDYH
jgi:hypothetical protein